MLELFDHVYHHANGLPQGLALCVISYLTLKAGRRRALTHAAGFHR